MENPYRFTVSYYDVPNRVDIEGTSHPVSLQNRNGDKRLMMESLRKALEENVTYLFLGDVKVSITWYITPMDRYSSHLVADLDNIIKPILDALTGPLGVLVDDNQVSALDVGWQDPGVRAVKVQISVMPHVDDRISRDGLMFVHFPGRGCWPVTSEAHANIAVPALLKRFESMRELTSAGISAEITRILDPIQRFYPRARLGSFNVREASDFLGDE